MRIAIAAVALAFGQAPALAQSAPEATTNTPAADAIGPRELQNFNLQGRVTRPAEPAPAPRTAAPTTRAPTAARSVPAQEEPRSTATAAAPASRRPSDAAETPPMAGAQSEGSARGSPQAAQTPGLSSRTVDLPTADVSPTGGLAATPASAADAGFTPDSGEMPASAPEQNLPIWPWLLAAMALGVGGAFLFWRRNSREAFAGGPQIDAFAAPEPLPRPRTPPAAPAPRSAPKSLGIVSTRLRPWIELSFEPLRCIVEDDRVTFEFQLGLFNSGSAAARDVLIEASLFNASPTQEREIGTFFERPVGQGDRIPTIAPLKRVELRPQIVMTLDQVRVLEAGGRKVFVPLVAFNSLYRWGAGEGQTSAAYLIGRKTKAEKLAPFRLDLGARVFRGLDARLLPIGIRD